MYRIIGSDNGEADNDMCLCVGTLTSLSRCFPSALSLSLSLSLHSSAMLVDKSSVAQDNVTASHFDLVLEADFARKV